MKKDSRGPFSTSGRKSAADRDSRADARFGSLVERDTDRDCVWWWGNSRLSRSVLGLEGVDAVVDKDLAAAVLARELGAELFLILTDVDAVYTGWGTEQQRAITSMSVTEADRLASEGAFGEGSMAPKVRGRGRLRASNTGPRHNYRAEPGKTAVQGSGGTKILP